MSLSVKLLLGRLLTRSGDQAWDFAVPIVLLKILPDHLRIAAIYYLLIRLAGVVFLPKLASLIDSKDRRTATRLGLGLQFLGVLFGGVSVYLLWSLNLANPSFSDKVFLGYFLLLVLSGILGSLGASLMDIAIANDLAPSVFKGQELASFNSRFRQVDLATEVGAPVIAGLLLAMSDSYFPLMGFCIVVVWNLVSFFPEYGILRSVFNERPDLNMKSMQAADAFEKSFWIQLHTGWRSFFKEPVALSMIAYALLWLSVLSPHGVLLTGFLQDEWKMPEWIIGLFRGSGAIFGLVATVLFPVSLRYFNVKTASHYFLGFQALMVLVGGAFFVFGEPWGQLGFLILILFSRVGLYGFSLGEMQIRQEGIHPSVRGAVNGFANALTGVATLALFAFGAALPTTADFKYLVFLSIGCVCVSFVIFTVWLRQGAGLAVQEKSF